LNLVKLKREKVKENIRANKIIKHMFSHFIWILKKIYQKIKKIFTTIKCHEPMFFVDR